MEKDKRSLVLPVPEPDVEVVIVEDNLDQAFNLKLRIYDSEEDRRKGTESKAAMFISTISVTTSIVVAANALITNSEQSTLAIQASVLVSFILSIYSARTVWFAVRALERGTYSVLGMADINHAGDKKEYQKHLIISLTKMNKTNRKVVNTKVGHVTMAQEYYKRAIITICLYAFLVVFFCFFFKRQTSQEPSKKFKPELNSSHAVKG